MIVRMLLSASQPLDQCGNSIGIVVVLVRVVERAMESRELAHDAWELPMWPLSIIRSIAE